MLEMAAAMCAGLGVTAAVLAATAPPTAADETGRPAWWRRLVRLWWAEEAALAEGAGLSAGAAGTVIVLQVAAAIAGGCVAAVLTGLPVLFAAGAAGAVVSVRGGLAARTRAIRVARQDAVIESVRMLRQLLETGATSVPTAIAILGERGPAPLRSEFRVIAATSVGRRQAWSSARQRIGEPLFDMLAAAVLIQGPGGGELAPLFADLEASVSGAQEVEREARALQVQARSAAAIIVSLPVVFLVVLSALRSPYLDAYHNATGQAFLLAMLAVMAGSYFWMRRLLLLPGLQRVRLADA
jgi:Flp pilus assembly protein TadB